MSRKTAQATPDAGIQMETFRDAFEALFDSGEAAALRARAEAVIGLREMLAGWSGTQAEKALRLKITQPRFNLLMNGKTGAVSLDFAAKIAARAGMEMKISYAKPRKAKTLQIAKPKRAAKRRADYTAHIGA